MTKTGVSQDLFVSLALELGFAPIVQSGFLKISGTKGRAYVARTKTVFRVDIAECVPPEHDAIIPRDAQWAKEMRLGKVRGQLDFTKPEAEILAGFKAVLETIA